MPSLVKRRRLRPRPDPSLSPRHSLFPHDLIPDLFPGKLMKLRETILKEHSKANCMRIVRWVGNDQKRFDELFYLFLNDEYRVVQRAGWPMTYCVEDHPELIKKHFAKVLKALEKPDAHDSIKRNT